MAKYLFYIDTIERTGGAQRVMSVLCNHFAKDNEVLIVNDYVHENNYVTASLLKNKNIRIKYLSENICGNFISKNIKRIKKLKQIIIEEKPDLCLSFLGGCNLRLLLCFKKNTQTKRIVSVRNDPNKEYSSNKIIKGIVNRIFMRADGIVFQTESAASYFNEKINLKSSIILNPIDEKFFETKKQSTKYDIVTLGRMNEQKNHKLLINAFNEIKFACPTIKLHIFGIGPLEKELTDLASSLGIKERVLFEGNTPNQENILSQSSIFVLSSDYEGMPNALMEAMASGLPCISTDCPCGGPKMLIENDVNGILIPCNDVEALSIALKTLANDEALRQKLGNNAKETSNAFRTDKILSLWENFFNKTVGDKK